MTTSNIAPIDPSVNRRQRPTMAKRGFVVPPPVAFNPDPSSSKLISDLAAAMVRETRKQARASRKTKADGGQGEGDAKKPAPPSLDKQWADRLIANQDWAAEIPDPSSPPIVRQWQGNHWAHVTSEMHKALSARWIDETMPDKANDARAEACVRYASTRLRHERAIKPPTKRNIVPCADVYLEIMPDGEIKAIEPDRALGITFANTIAVGTSPGTTHNIKPLPEGSRFMQFLRQALPDDETIALVQKICGMTLLPQSYSVAGWFSGAAGSGKSTIAELCEAMQRQAARTSLDSLGERFALEPLIGASLVIVDEVENEKWAEGRFKSLVSGNGVQVDRKYEKPLASYHLRAKWLITSNADPFVRDKSDGVWRRICLIKFGRTVPEEQRIPEFHNVLLREEGQAILDWMLEGARWIVQHGRFPTHSERPEAVRAWSEQVRVSTDSVRGWVTRCRVSVTTDQYVKKDVAFEAYIKYCERHHQDPLDRPPFWRAIRSSSLLAGFRESNRRLHGVQTPSVNLGWLGEEVELDPPPPVPNVQVAAMPFRGFADDDDDCPF